MTQFSCYLYNITNINSLNLNINYVNDKEGCPCFLMNHLFIVTIDFSSAISQVETIKLYKLLNTTEKLKYNHRKKSFNWCN